jgi:hypothetical protein
LKSRISSFDSSAIFRLMSVLYSFMLLEAGQIAPGNRCRAAIKAMGWSSRSFEQESQTTSKIDPTLRDFREVRRVCPDYATQRKIKSKLWLLK